MSAPGPWRLLDEKQRGRGLQKLGGSCFGGPAKIQAQSLKPGSLDLPDCDGRWRILDDRRKFPAGRPGPIPACHSVIVARWTVGRRRRYCESGRLPMLGTGDRARLRQVVVPKCVGMEGDPSETEIGGRLPVDAWTGRSCSLFY